MLISSDGGSAGCINAHVSLCGSWLSRAMRSLVGADLNYLLTMGSLRVGYQLGTT